MRKNQNGLRWLLLCYIFLLAWGILFKFALPPYQFDVGYRAVNWIPYHDLARTWDGQPDIVEIFLNILAFIPLGGLIQKLSRNKKVYRTFFACLLISLLFEWLQFFFAIGITDITDLIHNSLGSLIGILIVKMSEDFYARKD